MTDRGGPHLSYLLQALWEVQTFRLTFHPYLSELCDIPHLPLASPLDQVLPMLPQTVAFITSLVPRALVGKMVLSLPLHCPPCFYIILLASSPPPTPITNLFSFSLLLTRPPFPPPVRLCDLSSSATPPFPISKSIYFGKWRPRSFITVS